MRPIDSDAFEADCRKRYCTGCENYNGIKCKSCWVADMLDEIENAPTLSLDEVRGVGEWTRIDYHPCGHDYKCSECGDLNDRASRYCPSCGARMKGAEDGTTD